MITYKLDFSDYTQHLVKITLSFTAKTDAPTLWLPSWIPGSYLMREFARNITRVDATLKDESTPCTKLCKNKWQLPAVKADDKVTAVYEVYAYDLSVRSAYVDQTRLYGNFTSLALAVLDQEDEELTINFTIPQPFMELNRPVTVACTLPTEQAHNSYTLHADNYDELIDHPFELAKQDRFNFNVTNPKNKISLPHKFAMSGKHHANMERLQEDLTKICQAYLDWLGDAPFQKYQFMTMATGNDYGGLEHHNSTSLITPRGDLPSADEKDEPSKNYRNFLGLCSHEYFHAWWVKFIRPQVYFQLDLTQEVYTPLLWVFEGFTSYFDDLMLYRAGVVSKQGYLAQLKTQINRYYATHGRANQTVAESSFDAWIKLYRADENTANAGISYYNKGALVALCLDLTLQQQGKRLDDVVKALYLRAKPENQGGEGKRGIDDVVLDDIIGNIMGELSWQKFRADYIDGREELPIIELLTDAGISVSDTEKNCAFGLFTAKVDGGLKVTRTLREGAGAKAGISAKDIIIAVDNIKATEAVLKSASKRTEEVTIHFFRRDELYSVTLQPECFDIKCVDLKVDNDNKAQEWMKLVN